MQTSYYSNFIILFTALLLILVFLSFVTFLKRRYISPEILHHRRTNRAALEALEFLELEYIRHIRNPERLDVRPFGLPPPNVLDNIDVFMPVTKFGYSSALI